MKTYSVIWYNNTKSPIDGLWDKTHAMTLAAENGGEVLENEWTITGSKQITHFRDEGVHNG